MDAMSRPFRTRREAQRQATLDEIVTTARTQLREAHEISLRSVAQGMGMTAPALYRYVVSLEDLTLQVAARVYDDLLVALEAAAAPYEADVAAQIVAGAAAFRSWSLDNRDEFGLTFANPIIAGIKHAEPGANIVGTAGTAAADEAAELPVLGQGCVEAAHRFGGFFGARVSALWEQEGFPDGDDAVPRGTRVRHPLTGAELPPAAVWAYTRCWARLYGTTALEVFGHVDDAVVESGALFGDMLRECGEILGLSARLDELAAIASASADVSAG